MSDFIEVKASIYSLSTRKPKYGVGINDAWYSVRIKVDGKHVTCPYYSRWDSMLRRCYSKEFHLRQPTYIDCTVCEEWLTFSNFKCWMIKQDWQGKHLDKDLLRQGNKVYGPDFCIFADKEVNLLITDHKESKGNYPTGVSYEKSSGKYISRAHLGEKRVFIGRFQTKELAFNAYTKVKYENIRRVAKTQLEPLRSALLKLVIN